MFKNNLLKLRQKMKENNIDLAFITDDDSLYYFTGYYNFLHMDFARPTILIIPKDDDSWFLDDGGSTLVDRKEGITGLYGAEVKCIDIVDVLNKILNDNNLQQNKIKILKIDVEGAEYHILKRLIETKTIEIPQFIFFEDHRLHFFCWHWIFVCIYIYIYIYK